MKTSGISSLDHAPQVVAEWLNELDDQLGWKGKQRSYLLLRSTLHGVRDILSVDEAADLAAQLPLLIRGIYYDGWNPSATPASARSKTDFMAQIDRNFTKEPLENSEEAVVAIFDLLRRHVSLGEIEHVAHAMRKSLRDLWE